MKKYNRIIFFVLAAIVIFIAISQVAKKEPSPADINTRNETEFVVPDLEVLPLQDIEPLRTDFFDIQLLSDKSDVGHSGDILLTLIGSGFYLTSVSPRIIFDNGFIIENTEVNEKGNELYVILTKETLAKLMEKANFSEAAVSIGGNMDFKDSEKIFIKPGDFRNIDSLKIVSLKYNNGKFIREPK